STTLVTLVSRICMKATTMTDTVMAHFRAGETCGSSADDAVTAGPRRDPRREALLSGSRCADRMQKAPACQPRGTGTGRASPSSTGRSASAADEGGADGSPRSGRIRALPEVDLDLD